MVTGDPRLPCGEQEHQVTGTKAGTSSLFSPQHPLLGSLGQRSKKVVTGGQVPPDVPGSFLQALSCMGGQEISRGLEMGRLPLQNSEEAALSSKIWGGGSCSFNPPFPEHSGAPLLSLGHWGVSSEETGSGIPNPSRKYPQQPSWQTISWHHET